MSTLVWYDGKRFDSMNDLHMKSKIPISSIYESLKNDRPIKTEDGFKYVDEAFTLEEMQSTIDIHKAQQSAGICPQTVKL